MAHASIEDSLSRRRAPIECQTIVRSREMRYHFASAIAVCFALLLCQAIFRLLIQSVVVGDIKAAGPIFAIDRGGHSRNFSLYLFTAHPGL